MGGVGVFAEQNDVTVKLTFGYEMSSLHFIPLDRRHSLRTLRLMRSLFHSPPQHTCRTQSFYSTCPRRPGSSATTDRCMTAVHHVNRYRCFTVYMYKCFCVCLYVNAFFKEQEPVTSDVNYLCSSTNLLQFW